MNDLFSYSFKEYLIASGIIAVITLVFAGVCIWIDHKFGWSSRFNENT